MNIRKALGLATCVALCSLASADQRYFVLTYDWFTPSKFEREIELTYDHYQGGSGFAQLEFEYGITDRWMIAPYVLFEQEGGNAKFAGLQLEQRYRFGSFGYRKLMPAVYFEVHKESHESYELEGKLIGSYMPNSDWIVSGNFIVEQHIERAAKAEIGYSAGVSRIFSNHNIGIEGKGNFLENEHVFGPVVGVVLGDRTKISMGALKSFGKGNASYLRLLLEKEF